MIELKEDYLEDVSLIFGFTYHGSYLLCFTDPHGIVGVARLIWVLKRDEIINGLSPRNLIVLFGN